VISRGEAQRLSAEGCLVEPFGLEADGLALVLFESTRPDESHDERHGVASPVIGREPDVREGAA